LFLSKVRQKHTLLAKLQKEEGRVSKYSGAKIIVANRLSAN
jgi:hypothetical protein